MTTIKHRRVDFHRHDDDFDVALLGSLGFSTRMIAQRTGLSFCQVLYRLQKAHIKRADYRNGESNEAQAILNRLTPAIRPVVRSHIRLVEVAAKKEETK